MKWNWGTGLFVFFVIFVATLVFVLYQSTQVDNALVMDNYYEEDLNYQAHYEKKQNTADLPVKVVIRYLKETGELHLQFPDGASADSNITGHVWIYRPSDKEQDVSQSFQLVDELTWKIQIGNLESGRWKVKIDWKMGAKPYYQEEVLIF
jgi:nitrogen fixation protein FixH